MLTTIKDNGKISCVSDTDKWYKCCACENFWKRQKKKSSTAVKKLITLGIFLPDNKKVLSKQLHQT